MQEIAQVQNKLQNKRKEGDEILWMIIIPKIKNIYIIYRII